ncbi:hypothetical protein [Mesorhizobium kowhaii]|nr:hypothetical protein [Mesorhizobium kowhaii]
MPYMDWDFGATIEIPVLVLDVAKISDDDGLSRTVRTRTLKAVDIRHWKRRSAQINTTNIDCEIARPCRNDVTPRFRQGSEIRSIWRRRCVAAAICKPE